jgi:uncharacterized protein (DUF58 family)
MPPIADRSPADHAAAAQAFIRRWMRPPRRLRFSRSGWFFTVGALLLGVAAVGTGNNLLFLLLGAMLGFIVLSGWMSEQMLRRLSVVRRPPRGATAGSPARMTYEVRCGNRRMPSFSIEAGEAGRSEIGWIPVVAPLGSATVRVETVWPRRGVHALEGVTVATSFPFGLFRKERDLDLPGEVVVWPRAEMRLREPRPAGERMRHAGAAPAGGLGARGEYRGLRAFRPGDDPRDVHWRTTARLGEPVVREYERDRSRTLWICLDLRAPDDDAAEAAAETAASLAAGAMRRGDPFGLATAETRVDPGAGAAQFERVMDALARARFRPDAPGPAAPADRAACVLVTGAAAGGHGWGDVFVAEARP